MVITFLARYTGIYYAFQTHYDFNVVVVFIVLTLFTMGVFGSLLGSIMCILGDLNLSFNVYEMSHLMYELHHYF